MNWNNIFDFMCQNIRAVNIPIPSRPLRIFAIYLIKKQVCREAIFEKPKEIDPNEQQSQRKRIKKNCDKHQKNFKKWTKKSLKTGEQQSEKHR